jgi:nucleoside-diphosphate kinase
LIIYKTSDDMDRDFTFAIIKPNAVRTGKTGPILAMINEGGFDISAMRMVRLTRTQAETFYEVHKGKSFFDSLIEFMTSGPVVVMVLKHENAVEEFRKLIGATDPSKADPGTIRKIFAVSVQMNAVHGSDSMENAYKEANFFFSTIERFDW